MGITLKWVTIAGMAWCTIWLNRPGQGEASGGYASPPVG
jgi:hypothetical protein